MVRGHIIYVPFVSLNIGVYRMSKWSKRQARKRIKRIEKKEKPKNRKKVIEVILYLLCLAAVVYLAYAIVRYGFVETTMVGESMEETLKNDDELLVNKLIYKVTKPKRFDIIAYAQNSSEHRYLTIKRVVGLPGEKIRINDGNIYINGDLLSEDINVEPMNTGGLAEDELLLDDGEYFVLGDNRNNSQDSRFNTVGTIVKDDIIGKVWFRLNSFANVSSLNLKGDDEEETEK